MEDTKRCEWCAEEILAAAIKCKHCGELVARPPAGLSGPVLSEDCPVCGAAAGTGGLSVRGHLKRQHGMSDEEAQATVAADQAAQGPPEPGSPPPPPCPHCAYRPTSSRDAFLHESNVHTGRSATGTMTRPTSSRSPSYTGKGGRKKLSSVGTKTEGGLACPKCGGMQFTAKRSKKGKIIGFTTLGVGGLVAPKSQVKCVTCGTMFKRG